MNFVCIIKCHCLYYFINPNLTYQKYLRIGEKHRFESGGFQKYIFNAATDWTNRIHGMEVLEIKGADTDGSKERTLEEWNKLGAELDTAYLFSKYNDEYPYYLDQNRKVALNTLLIFMEYIQKKDKNETLKKFNPENIYRNLRNDDSIKIRIDF